MVLKFLSSIILENYFVLCFDRFFVNGQSLKTLNFPVYCTCLTNRKICLDKRNVKSFSSQKLSFVRQNMVGLERYPIIGREPFLH